MGILIDSYRNLKSGKTQRREVADAEAMIVEEFFCESHIHRLNGLSITDDELKELLDKQANVDRCIPGENFDDKYFYVSSSCFNSPGIGWHPSGQQG